VSAPSWADLEVLFHEALARAPADRAAFLTERCAGRPDLQAEVEALLRAHEGASGSWEMPSEAPQTRLKPGARVGPYEVVAALGAGGMGEVYRAHDRKLGRDVAFKILPRIFTADPDRLARFEREARVLASLNHPHIGAIYGVEDGDGVHALVLELVEGETLADRLTKGALPLNQVLRIAIQIASALDAAHRAGIVHRDLKPGNIMLARSGGASATPMAKLLDFGLAKASASAVAGADPSMLPTSPPSLTAPGTILGTCQYMAPEQLEGREADARTDIFAFGAVLYEMLTGKKAFEGTSHASVSAAIMSAAPAPVSALQPLTPPALDRVVATCLAKDPDERWQSAGDLARELKWIAESGMQVSGAAPRATPVRARARLAWVMAAVATAAALGLGALQFARARPEPAAAIRFQVSPPAGSSIVVGGPAAPWQALSPDGQRIAFVVITAGQYTLAVRSFDAGDAHVLPGTEGGNFPFWSPDSRFIGFFAQGKLKKIDVAGGPPLTLCDASAGEGGTWNRDGTIVFAPHGTSGLLRVSAAGGVPAPVTTLDAAKKEQSHRWPWFLPDGRRFLYMATPQTTVYVGSLDAEERTPLLASESKVIYADGYLLFMRQGTLLAQSFDAARLRTMGESFRVAENVGVNMSNARAAFSASTTGVLTYRTSPPAATQVTWFDRSGKRLESIGEPGDYRDVSLSPDGSRAIVHRHEEPSGGGLWLLDFARGTTARFTFDTSHNDSAHWSPDGSRIVFRSDREGGDRNLYEKIASGAGPDELLLTSSEPKDPTNWSSDGRFIVYISEHPKTGVDLWVLPLSGDRKPMSFLRTPFDEGHGRLSPDGRWMTYTSNETGRNEVYGQPFPPSGGKWQVSTSGGAQPRWRRDGKELYYLAGAGGETAVMAVEVRATESTFEVGVPKALFRTRIAGAPPQTQVLGTATESSYAGTADGQRFLILTPPLGETAQEPITVVLNWTARLKK
jgi:Tol biopolymer transport system component